MNLITSTELRTKTNELMEALSKGEEITIIHRSKVVGTIKPAKQRAKVFDVDAVMKIAEKMNLPKLSPEEREKRYRSAMIQKHGKHLSGLKFPL